MTNGEKFKEVFKISQVDDCDLNIYVWLPIHDAIEIPLEWWNAEYKEPTTDDCAEQNGCITCSLDDGDDCCRKLFEESMQEPTTKNDSAHNLCDSCINYKCEFQSGIVRPKCAFYMPPQLEPDNCGKSVLDKIRAEIAELSHYYPMGHDYQIAITRCLAVVDKYKVGSEYKK